MDMTVLIAFLIGAITGGSILYIRQRKLRMEELGKAAAMTEDILADRKLSVSSRGMNSCWHGSKISLSVSRRYWTAGEKRRRKAGTRSRS